jgi:DNA-binding response OmpR family regulator
MRLLLVDDEPGVLLALGDQLRVEGYEVETASDGEEAYGKIGRARPDLVVLDVMLPRLNGFQLCKRLRREGNDVPILFLSAKAEETDVVLGLGFGADDYVTKPFGMREVVARIEAVLRRTSDRKAETSEAESLRLGDVVLDFVKFEARRGGARVELTPREFRILRYLAGRAGEVVTRDEILDQVWGEDIFVTHRSVDNQIYGIRQKIERDPHRPAHLLSIRSVGYKLILGGEG